MTIWQQIGQAFSWWPAFRDKAEAEIEQIALALEPTVKADLLSAVKIGVASGLNTVGTPGDQFVAARKAAEAYLAAQGTTIATQVLQAAIMAEMSAAPATPVAA